jgi:hypothetical protein
LSLRRGWAQNTPVRVIVSLSVALLIGIAAGLAWDELDPPLAALERQVTEQARRDVRAGHIKGPVLRSECSPVRATPNRWSCVAIRFETELGHGGQTYEAARNRRTGEFRVSRFEIPIWWGV